MIDRCSSDGAKKAHRVAVEDGLLVGGAGGDSLCSLTRGIATCREWDLGLEQLAFGHKCRPVLPCHLHVPIASGEPPSFAATSGFCSGCAVFDEHAKFGGKVPCSPRSSSSAAPRWGSRPSRTAAAPLECPSGTRAAWKNPGTMAVSCSHATPNTVKSCGFHLRRSKQSVFCESWRPWQSVIASELAPVILRRRRRGQQIVRVEDVVQVGQTALAQLRDRAVRRVQIRRCAR